MSLVSMPLTLNDKVDTFDDKVDTFGDKYREMCLRRRWDTLVDTSVIVDVKLDMFLIV